SACAPLVFNNDGLSELILHISSQRARHIVIEPAWREGYGNDDGLCRIGLGMACSCDTCRRSNQQSSDIFFHSATSFSWAASRIRRRLDTPASQARRLPISRRPRLSGT